MRLLKLRAATVCGGFGPRGVWQRQDRSCEARHRGNNGRDHGVDDRYPSDIDQPA